MNQYADTTYVRAKIYALKKTFFNKEDYLKVINSGTIKYLYPELYDDRDDLRYLLNKEIIFKHQLLKLRILIESNNEYAPLFKSSLTSFEIKNIKLLILKNLGIPAPLRVWFDVTPYNILPNNLYNQVLSKSDITNLLKRFNIDSDSSGEAQDNESPYEYLDEKLYCEMLKSSLKHSRNLNSRDKKIFEWIYLFNFVSFIHISSLRLKENYGYKSERIIEFADKRYQSIHKIGIPIERILSIQKEIRVSLLKRGYSIDEESAIQNIQTIELVLFNLHFSMIDKLYCSNFHSIISLVCFIWMIRYQIANLFTIIEGFRFNISREEISRRMICGL